MDQLDSGGGKLWEVMETLCFGESECLLEQKTVGLVGRLVSAGAHYSCK